MPASLASVPWACLPGLRHRPFTITPSLSVWAHVAALEATTDGATLLADGPDLNHADPEVHALTRLHDDAVALDCAAATPAAVLPALDGTGLAHLACHGVINPANPLLSRLLHRRLLAEDSPAAALAAVRIGVGAPPVSLAFTCFGVG